MAMTLVSTVTVTSTGVTSIGFSNIPQTGKDLYILFSSRDNNTAQNPGSFQMLINGGGYILVGTGFRGTGTQVFSASAGGTGTLTLDATNNNGSYTSNVFANGAVTISNYTGNLRKSISLDAVTENLSSASWQYIWAQAATVTTGITSLTFNNSSNDSLAIGSSISLYTIS